MRTPRARRLTVLACAIALAAPLVACGDSPTGGHTPPDTRIVAVTPDFEVLYPGETASFTVVVTRAAGDTVRNPPLTWRADDPAVVSVSKAGVLTALRPGSTRVRISLGSDTASAGVTVTHRIATLQHPSLPDTLVLGADRQVAVTAFDSAGAPVSDALVRWTSSDSTVVAVDDFGRVRAVGWGEATVTVASQTVRHQMRVAVRFKRLGADLTWTSLGVGTSYACALSSAGAAYCWGDNSDGRLGNNDAHSDVPQAVQGGHVFSQLAVGRFHNCALEADGSAWCWGSNSHAQLGVLQPTGSSSTPLRVRGSMRWKLIAVGGHGHTCALPVDSDVPYCWGHNDLYQLGRLPHRFTDTAIAPVFEGAPVRSISPGDFHSCEVRLDRSAYCTGQGGLGELGNGALGAPDTTPVRVVGNLAFDRIKVTATNGNDTCALITSGAAYCWGDDSGGKLGNGIVPPEDGAFHPYTSPQPVVGGHAFTDIAPGETHTCGVTIAAGAFCWGRNESGQLGAYHAGPIGEPLRVAGPYAFRGVYAGVNETCGLTTDGAIYCWGGQYAK